MLVVRFCGILVWSSSLHTDNSEIFDRKGHAAHFSVQTVGVDFFTVPTAAFGVLFMFLVLAHHRRKVLHFNVTESPSAS
jgi:hypothetical protein